MLKRGLCVILSGSMVFGSVSPALASELKTPAIPSLPASAILAPIVCLPPSQALAAMAQLPPGTPQAQAALLVQGLAAYPGQVGPAALAVAAQTAGVPQAQVQAFAAQLAAQPQFSANIQGLRAQIGGTDSLERLATNLSALFGEEARAGVAQSLFSDLLSKYDAAAELTQSPRASLPAADLRLPLGQLLTRLAAREHPSVPEAERKARVDKALSWLRQKYGVLDRPLLAEVGPRDKGSYETPGTVGFAMGKVVLPSIFDAKQESSIQDLDGYVARKWGGLAALASPERLIFSELGTTDTLAGLRRAGYTQFHTVNGPYASRGSKTLLASKPGEEKPAIVFYSFVGKDLMTHKLLQLAHEHGERLSQVRVLGSDSLKSWDVADLVVARAFAKLPERRIDDLVVGYGEAVEGVLAQGGKLAQTARVGDFATIKYYSITGKTGLEKTVAVLTDVELRYFGKSALALIKPFLTRGIDRVIFAGSAGSFDASVPLHGLVVPRQFHQLADDGALSRAAVDNDLYDLLPYGQSWSGKHVSVTSPLVESRAMVKRLRDEDGMLSVDVEGSKLAELIASHNAKYGTRIRYGAAFLVTDTPTAAGEKAKDGYGLHAPNFSSKAEAKKNYAAALALLWDVPGGHRPSNHTKLIGKHFARRIATLKAKNDAVGLAALARELEDRLAAVRQLQRQDRRVSRGLLKTYRDLLRDIEKEGVGALAQLPAPAAAPLPKPVPRLVQRAVMLQSLTRSSTLSSGQVAFKTDLPAQKLRAQAVENAERAVDYVLSRADWPLSLEDMLKLKAILHEGVREDKDAGFAYKPEDGPEVTSQQELQDFAEWFAKAKPSPEAALEAFLRLEELHPFGDGNGRVAELVAQHMMLRAAGQPLLFPNRFDVDYILSLRRNGSGPRHDARQLANMLKRSTEFSAWLTPHATSGRAPRAWLNRETGLLNIQGHLEYEIVPLFKAERTLELEREARVLLDAGQDYKTFKRRNNPIATLLVQKHAEYEVGYGLFAGNFPPPAPAVASAVPADAVLNFGGSFSPPTLQHMGILAHLMRRLGFTKAKMVLAYPYKKGAAPAEVGSELTRLAVETMSEVLTLNSLPFKNFSSAAGSSSWTGEGGRRYAVAVEEFDVKSKNTETLNTLRHLRELHGGNAKANYWLSGGDSFGSVPTWTPKWREMFALSNWVVIARPGFEGVDFGKQDPLNGLFPKDFLAEYIYSFDAAKQMHVYANVDAAKPGIFIVDQPSLDDSSSKNRKSLQEDAERAHAQDGLQPSVFRRAVEKGYFAKEGNYTALTERNLDIYTSQFFERIANPDGEPVTDQERADYEKLSSELAKTAKAIAQEEAAQPLWKRVVGGAVEHVKELLENVLSIAKLRRTARKFYEKFGKDFGRVYLFGELVLEPIILPAIAWVLAGPAAAGAIAFMHPNETMVMPAYILYRLLKMLAEKRRLAGGELKLYQHLTNYRRRLARGDPESIAARVELGGGLALGGAPMTVNVVKSRLPKIVPLFLRKLDDRRVTWHDLNLSTNELKAILSNGPLADRLDELSGRSRGLYAHRMLSAIEADAAARTRLDLFLSHRYFKRLALGQVDEQLVGGFSQAERAAIASLKGQAEGLRRALLPEQQGELAEITADFYSLMRALRADPARAQDPAFWETFYDMTATRYPDKKRARGDQALLDRRLAVLSAMAEAAGAGSFDALKTPPTTAELTTAKAVRSRTLLNAAVEYAKANQELFKSPTAPAGLRLLPTASRGDDLDRANLVWEMGLLRDHVARQLALLGQSYGRAERHLAGRRPHKRAERVFWDARETIEDDIAALDVQLRRLEYEWLRLKFPHQVGAAARDERLISGYQEIAARYEALRAQYDAHLEAYRAVNHMMFGTTPSPVQDAAALREIVGRRIALGQRPNMLGYGIVRRTAAHAAGALRGWGRWAASLFGRR